MITSRSIACLWLCTIPSLAAAQAPAPAGTTPPSAGAITRAMSWAETHLDNSPARADGFYPELGGMITGSGLSVGPGYRRHVLGGRAIVDASAAVAFRGSTMAQGAVAWPRLLNDRVTAGAQLQYQDFTHINFFGIGNETLKTDRTDYRLKSLDATAFGSVRMTPWLSATARTGMIRNLTIDQGGGAMPQPRYLHTDVALDADTLDVPGYPRSGGRYRVSFAMFRDRDFNRYSFQRIEGDGAQYIPLGRSVLALRGRIGVATPAANQEIPFYLLPSLGGSRSLGGYLDYRFRDRDLLLANAEYRWPILRRVDGAVFYEAGSVGPTLSTLPHGVHADYGAGVRVHSARRMLVRLDVAQGAEGPRAVMSFSTSLAPPSRTVAPYVP
jgi:outer membrane protein assembly factor BamA